MPPARLRDQSTLLTLVEEATHLLRSTRAGAWFIYCAGTAPFITFLFFFWSDMSRSSMARAHLRDSSLILALLYWWMKLCQALFCGHLLRILEEEKSPRPMPRRGWLRLISSQAWIHATMPWVFIVAGIAVLPMGWAYAFYHNVTVLAVEHYRNGGRTKDLIGQALAQSNYRPGQNHVLGGLLLVIGLLTYMNLIAGFALGAFLLKAITGVENEFSRNGSLLFSSPMQLLLISGSYFVLWPLVKSFYVLRCFYGQARRTGADLKVQLRRLAAVGNATATAGIVVILLALAPASRGAEPFTPSAPPAPAHPVVQIQPHGDALGRSIKEVLSSNDYQWRFPREQGEAGQDDSWLGAMVRDVVQHMRDMMDEIAKAIKDWLFKAPVGPVTGPTSQGGYGAWVAWLPYLLIGLVVLLLAMLGILVYRNWKRTRAQEPPATGADAAPPINLESEHVVASQLPENEWLRMAREKMEAGEYRLALRALFLATLAHLGDKRIIQVSRTKSNGDYLHEVDFRARSQHEVSESFHEEVRVFDRIWYGWHEVTKELVVHFQEHHERIVSHAA